LTSNCRRARQPEALPCRQHPFTRYAKRQHAGATGGQRRGCAGSNVSRGFFGCRPSVECDRLHRPLDRSEPKVGGLTSIHGGRYRRFVPAPRRRAVGSLRGGRSLDRQSSADTLTIG
jgi:hypothetical protein